MGENAVFPVPGRGDSSRAGATEFTIKVRKNSISDWEIASPGIAIRKSQHP